MGRQFHLISGKMDEREHTEHGAVLQSAALDMREPRVAKFVP